jgi:hypothetical protein
MNNALGYLWFTLLKRRTISFIRSLRRPATLVGFAAVVALLGFAFYFRQHKEVGHLVEPRTLVGGALIMLCGSLFKGFLQRGLVFDPPDIDFLFTSPFTQRQIIFYRLFSSYFFSVIQGLVFLALFEGHLRHGVLTACCVTLFQIVCFHLSTAAAIYGGAIPESLHERLRWMLLATFLFLTALYLRVAWGLRLVPSWFGSPFSGLLFYPAVTLPDIANSVAWHRWAVRWSGSSHVPIAQLWEQLLYLGGFLTGALFSLWLLLKLKGNIFEPALAPSARRAERHSRLRQGRKLNEDGCGQWVSARLPRARIFGGVGAIVWKNLIVARRSKRELLWVSGFAFIYTGFTFALLYLYHHFAKKAGVTPAASEAEGFHVGIATFLAGLTFFLQRMVPFDFRRDGHHLERFRTLPVTSFGLALAELSVPTGICLALQAPCILALVWYSNFPAAMLLLIVAAYPAVVLALNSVWNLHYLLAAAKRASGESITAVGNLIVVALSFLVFYPASWTMFWIGRHQPENSSVQLPLAAGLAVQYGIDMLMILLLARLFQRVEVGREA